ncbi:unnamed protein product [Lymnaea stagnalis]|uniref:Uncharacterized protein n=1 Tax=Lymnaea stagnalis TaxID=6523 RepID=A0AAV2IKN1_LYMST
MDNLYEILHCRFGDSVESLKKSYMSLVRLHHPDKLPQHSSSDSGLDFQRDNVNTEMFIKIDRAWKILSNPHLRAQYDAKWHERTLVQNLPIQDTVFFKDFEFDETENMYKYTCRCGSYYLLSNSESEFHFDIICCDTCSLTIKVNYENNKVLSEN